MKKVFAMLVAMIFATSFVLGIETSVGIGIDIQIDEFKPLIWLCDSSVLDDYEENWHDCTLGGEPLMERWYNYAFEGEQLVWEVLVMDKNKIQEIQDVYVIMSAYEGATDGEFVVECIPSGEQPSTTIPPKCNARIGQEELTQFDPAIMEMYLCRMTVEPKASMYQEYWVSVAAESKESSGLTEFASIDEDEYWYFNPVVGLTISDQILFDNVANGVQVYSNTVLVENDADPDSGVHMEMFIGGQDFRPGPGEDGTCIDPTNGDISNYLVLGDNDATNDCDMPADFSPVPPQGLAWWDTFCYYAVNGAYSTADLGPNRIDAEGYAGIPTIRNNYGILDAAPLLGEYATTGCPTQAEIAGNVLGPGDEVSLTLKLMIPEPCTGSFSDGQINIYGEAI